MTNETNAAKDANAELMIAGIALTEKHPAFKHGFCITGEQARSILAQLTAAEAVAAALRQIVEGDLDPDVGLTATKGLFHEAAPQWMRQAADALAAWEATK